MKLGKIIRLWKRKPAEVVYRSRSRDGKRGSSGGNGDNWKMF